MGSGRRALRFSPMALGVVCACGSAPGPSPGASTPPSRGSLAPPAPSTAREVADAPAAVDACPVLAPKVPELIPAEFDVPVPELVDFSAKEQMAPFYEKLARLARGRSKDHVRILMYGDSNLTRDDISGELRRTLQHTFGDGGHGYIGVGKPWSWYIHNDVRHGAEPKAWKVFSMSTDQVADRLYGFGGLAAQNIIQKAHAFVATAPDGAEVGSRVSRFQVMHLRRPNHGSFDVLIDGKQVARVDSAGPKVEAAIESFRVPDGAHKLELVSEADLVRLLGVVMERDSAGIVVDSVGIGGVNSELLARGDRALTLSTLAMRHHDLVLILTGATEPDAPGQSTALKELVTRHREALPEAPFMILSPPDLAGGTPKNPMPSVRIKQVEKYKLRTAEEEKAMYWDFRAAMGGELSIVRFAEHKMAWNDFIHLTGPGGRYMGRRLAYALVRDFARYLTKHPRAGCEK